MLFCRSIVYNSAVSAIVGTALKIRRFAFVACNKNPQRYMQDPSFIYRCENLALALSALGHQTSLLHYTELAGSAQYDVVMFHRPSYRFGFRWLVNRLRKSGAVVMADVDDLIFDPNYAGVSPGVVNQTVSLRQTQKNFTANAKALAVFNLISTSTAPLAAKLQQQLADSKVIQLANTVHQSWYQYDEPTLKQPLRLTYFPGTRSHDRDFASISAPLAEFLHQYPQAELHITGVLNCQLKCRPNQLFLHDKQPFTSYASHVAQSYINLAPLENTEFNQHKSALKAIEASFFNAPTIASPIPDMARLSHCGAILAAEDNQWFDALQALTNEQHYQQQSRHLRHRLLENANIKQQAQHLLQFINTL